MYEIKRAKRLSQAFVHFVTARASLFADHRMSGLPMRAKHKHFRTICEQTFNKFLDWWSSRHGVETLYTCWMFCVAESQYRSTHFMACPSMSQDQAIVFRAEFLPARYLFSCSRDSRFELFLIRQPYLRLVYIRVGCIPSTHGINFFHMGLRCCFSPANLMSSTYTDKNNPCFRWTKK